MQQSLAPRFTYKRTYDSISAVIPAGQTQSNIIDVGGMILLRLITDENWSTSSVTFNVYEKQYSLNNYGNSTVLNNYDGLNNSALTIPALSLRTSVPFYAHWFASVPYIQIVSAATQTNTTTITLVCEPLWQGVHG